ncbi:MAG: DegT/DnrJ/EryC1/StrS family aminotransferase, partial [Pseudomonadota bacterium]
MKRLRALPPGGEPLTLAEIIGAASCPQADFGAYLRAYLNARHCLPVSSGTAALTVALRALRALRPERAEVVIPAYTCPNVLAAVVQAGLTPVLADVAEDGCGYDLEQLSSCLGEATLAVVAVHLFGIPADMDVIGTAAGERGAFVVEDAAQA